jgi:hypothetical protein
LGGAFLQGINKESVLRCIQPKDLGNPDCIAQHFDIDQLAQRAFRIRELGFSDLKLEGVTIKGNVAHCVRSTPHLIMLRCLNRIIRQATQTVPSDRDIIIRRLGASTQPRD